MTARESQNQHLVEALTSAVDEVFGSLVPTPVERLQVCGVELGEAGSRVEVETSGGTEKVALDLEARVDFLDGDLRGRVLVRCNTDGADEITRGMLMMDESEDVDPCEMHDALGECANMLAGGVKTRVLDPSGEFQLGLPEIGRPQSDEEAPSQNCVAYAMTKGTLEMEIWLDESSPGDGA